MPAAKSLRIDNYRGVKGIQSPASVRSGVLLRKEKPPKRLRPLRRAGLEQDAASGVAILATVEPRPRRCSAILRPGICRRAVYSLQARRHRRSTPSPHDAENTPRRRGKRYRPGFSGSPRRSESSRLPKSRPYMPPANSTERFVEFCNRTPLATKIHHVGQHTLVWLSFAWDLYRRQRASLGASLTHARQRWLLRFS